MKNKQLIILPVFALLASCGQKNPVSDLSELRARGKVAEEIGPQKPTIQTNTIVVEKEVEKVREQSTIDEKFIVITPDAQMSFSEGQSTSFKVRARVLIPDVEISLTAQGLPEGATLAKSTNEKETYILTWKPALYTTGNASMKMITVKFLAQISKAGSSEEAAKLKGLVREKESTLILIKNQESPSELNVAGLATELTEGTITPLTITVKVPGLDDKAPLKPRLNVSYDGVSTSAGNSFLEMDGSRYVTIDLNKKEAVYLGNSKWQFSLLFDTKNISVQPQLDTNKNVITAADGTRVRLSFKVYNLANGLSTPEVLSQVKVKYNKPAVTGAQ